MTNAMILEGVGGYLPDRVVTNAELSTRLDTSDEWIRSRTGIRQRHVAAEGETSLHLAIEAGARALKSAGGGDVDAVVVATTTPDRLCPANGPAVASALGLGSVAAFDVAAVCTGFVYAAATASGLIAAGIADRVLVIGTEAISRFLHPDDRNVGVIFGDGAGAIVVRGGKRHELGAFGAFDLGSDGDGADLIKVDGIGSRTPPSLTQQPASIDAFLAMDGREVYRRAIPAMVASSQKVLDAAGWSVNDVDCLVGHQANVRILDAVASRLGVPAERSYINLDRVGNTAGASVPLALADAHADGVLRAGDRVLITAFGGGLTWGSTTLTWPELPTA